MKRVVPVVSFLLCCPVLAQEMEITILGITLPGSDYNAAVEQLNTVETWWNQYPYDNISIRLANFGWPVPMDAFQTGILSADLQVAMQTLENMEIRKDADIIMFFAQETTSGICGYAPQLYWTDFSEDPVDDRFHGGANGLDLRGAEDSYATIMHTGGECGSVVELALHELGHLHGGGHETEVATPDCCLYTDSHASDGFYFFGQGPFRTLLSTGFLPNGQPSMSSIWPFYSDNASLSENNTRAVVRTAESVAHYRVTQQEPLPPPPNDPPPPLPPGYSLQVPIDAAAVYVPPACNPYPSSRYNFYWNDMCPSATTHYLVEDQQPAGAGPWVETGTTLWPGLAVGIQGSPGFLRVRACNGGTCSAPSNTVYITDQC